MSTQFQHKRIHKGTWLAPDQATLNQIDHVLITSKEKDLNEDIRSLRGPNIDSSQDNIKPNSFKNLYNKEESNLIHGINQT